MRQAAGRGGAPPPPAVTVAKPIQKNLAQWDEYTGRFTALETVEVRARVSGFIDSVHFKEGQIVKKDDLLFTIDQRPYQIAVEQAKADLDRAQAKLEIASLDVQRATPLVQNQTVTRARVRYAEIDGARRRRPGRIGPGGAEAGRAQSRMEPKCARRSPGAFRTGASMPAI